MISKLGVALFAASALVMSTQALAQEKLTVWWVRGFYKSEDDALFAAIKKFEDKTGVKVELSQYPVQDMIPKTVAALDAGTPPDVAYADVYDFQVAGKWAYDGKLEDISRHPRADQGQVPEEHARDDLPVQRQDQEEGVLRVSAEAADDAHPVLEGHAGRGGLQGIRHPDRVEGLLGLLVRQGAAGAPQQDRQAHLRDRPADGRRLERLVLLVPDVHGRVQRQAGRRQRQAAGRRSEGEGRASSTRCGTTRASARAAARRRRRRRGRTRTTTCRSTTRRS